MPDIEFLPVATAISANVEDQGDYAGSAVQNNGVTAGPASSAIANKMWRQATFPAAALAAYMGNILNEDVLDNGNLLEFWEKFWRSMLKGGYFLDVGSANALLVSEPFGLTFPAPTVGLRISLRVAHKNTDETTFNWMGTGNVPVVYSDGSVLQNGDLPANGIVDLEFDGTSWQLLTMTVPAQRNRLGRLFQSVAFYVSTTGNDANDGITAGTALRTIQAAVNLIQSSYSDLANFTATVYIAPGNYTQRTRVSKRLNGIVKFTVNGSGNVNISVANQNCFEALGGAYISIDGGATGAFVLSATSGNPGITTEGCAILTDNQSTTDVLNNITFAACSSYHIANLGITTMKGDYTITGGGVGHIHGTAGQFDTFTGVVIHTVGSPAFTAFATAFFPCSVSFSGASFTGSGAAGKKYDVKLNAVIYTGTGDINFLPGNIAGTDDSGGQYA